MPLLLLLSLVGLARAYVDDDQNHYIRQNDDDDDDDDSEKPSQKITNKKYVYIKFWFIGDSLFLSHCNIHLFKKLVLRPISSIEVH